MPRKTTVLFIWNVRERLRNYLRSRLKQLPHTRLVFPDDISQENLLKLASDANVIVGWRPTKELLEAAGNLQLFINPGAGVQHLIDLFREVNSERPVQLSNCHGNSYFVAQHAVALLLALTNKIVPHHNWMAAGKWRKGDEDAKSTPLRDRKIGFLGYGAVNQKVHRFLLGFNLSYSILRRDWSGKPEKLTTLAKQYNSCELHKFLREVDTLMIAVPLTSLTQNMIKLGELELLGSSGLVVNVARGGIVEEESLYAALKSNVIAGAAIDVWYDYQPSSDNEGRRYPFSHPFHTLQNVVLSPHRAASPFDDLDRWEDVVTNIAKVSRGEGKLENVVDLKQEY